MIRACIFDAYGTLFDVAGAARAAAAQPGGERLATLWPRLAEDWRRKQIEYSWHRTLTGNHADFAQVTADGLDWALEAAGISDATLRAHLLALYDRLPCYPEVPGVLAELRTQGVTTAILSNGTPAMLAAATAAAGIAVDHVLSVEEVGRFKPDPAVYALIEARLGIPFAEMLFLSSNGWDVAGAAAFGLTPLWINRAGLPVERLPHGPAAILPDLTPLPRMTRP